MSHRQLTPGVAACAVSLMLVLAGCGKTSTPSSLPPTSAPGHGDKQASTSKCSVSFSAEELPSTASDTNRGEGSDAEASAFGRIVGVVKWNGLVPEPERIAIAKDAHVCAEHGSHDRLSELLIVNPSGGGVKDAVISLVGKFESGKPLSELQHHDTLNQRTCSYEPRVFVVPVGARLAITSEDEVGHNVRMSGAADLNIAVSRGGRGSRRLEQAGLVRLGCDIHPWMTGFIHVVKHPYHAVTDTDGQFELTDVPVGTHQIRLWHEAWWTEAGKVADPIVVTESVTIRGGGTTRATFELIDPTQTRTAERASANSQLKNTH